MTLCRWQKKYAVAITFLYPIEKHQSENVKENIEKFRKNHNNNSFVEHLKKNSNEKKLGFNAKEIIDGNESENNRQIRYELEQNAWAMHVAENGAKWKI